MNRNQYVELLGKYISMKGEKTFKINIFWNIGLFHKKKNVFQYILPSLWVLNKRGKSKRIEIRT